MLRTINLKPKNGYKRSIVLEPLIPINYIKNNSECKHYWFARFPSLDIWIDRFSDEYSIGIRWLMGQVEFVWEKPDERLIEE